MLLTLGIIFVDILHRSIASCKIQTNIIPNHVKMSVKHDMGELF